LILGLAEPGLAGTDPLFSLPTSNRRAIECQCFIPRDAVKPRQNVLRHRILPGEAHEGHLHNIIRTVTPLTGEEPQCGSVVAI